ncbi:MAG TPA: hypothetical protein VH478_03565 [Trebonia sp.]|nr:hypothetical protein [Trebonia sp.]
MSTWDDDTGPHPLEPADGAVQTGYHEADPPLDEDGEDYSAWFEPVSYDQTDYQNLDPYLYVTPEGVPEASHEEPGHGAPGGDGSAGYEDLDHAGALRGDPHPTQPQVPWDDAPVPPGDDAHPDDSAYPGDSAYPDDDAFRDETAVLAGAGVAAHGARRADAASTRAGSGAPPLTGLWPRDEAEPAGPPPPPEPWLRRPPRRPRRPGWLTITACGVTAAALGFGLVALTHRGHPSLPSSALSPGSASAPAAGGAPAPGGAPAAGGGVPSPSSRASTGSPASASPSATTAGGASGTGGLLPPVSQAQAQQVLAHYTAANNDANTHASQPTLTGVETGSSLAIDIGVYKRKQVTKAAPYPPYTPVGATYYIPRESPATYPHWFAVHVRNAFAAKPAQVVNGEYLVFTQAAPGAPWRDALEPFIVSSAAEPGIAVDANGNATAVALNDPTLAVAPSAASGATAAQFNQGTPPVPNSHVVASVEETDAIAQAARGSHAVIAHCSTPDPVFGLRTTDGGALLFYDVGSALSLTAPAGGQLRLNVPGFVAPAAHQAKAIVDYLLQFAMVDPAKGHGTTLTPVADYSGTIGTGTLAPKA